MPLKDVFQKIFDKEKGGSCIDSKSADAELKKYLKGVFPEYDDSRVYISDIKKLLSWYNILQKQGLLTKEEEKKPEEKVKVKAAADKEVKPAAKAKAKSTSTKPAKTAGSKVKVAGVRKTGTA